jgi:hypothetical protein
VCAFFFRIIRCAAAAAVGQVDSPITQHTQPNEKFNRKKKDILWASFDEFSFMINKKKKRAS